MLQKLTDFEKDQLIEVVNIGAGNASTALSQLAGKGVEINVPNVFIDRVEKVPQILGEPEKIMTAVLLRLLGDAPGIMLLMFPPESALNLAGLLTKSHKKNIKVLDEIDRSALREVGNILSGAGMTALSKFLDINILQSVPDAATDMLGSVVDTVLAEIGKESDVVLLFKVTFDVKGEPIKGRLFFLFDPKATTKILIAAKAKINKK